MDLVEASGTGTQRHPWEQVRYRFLEGVLSRAGVLGSAATVLDVGAGDGWFAAQLAAAHPGSAVTCWDPGYSEEALRERAGARSGCRFTNVRPTVRFDVVLLLDVLEHVDRDEVFLRELVADNLRPDGHLLITVPAWRWLFSSHDARLQHRRRYAPAQCRHLLAATGLEIVQGGGLFHSLLPVRAAMTWAERAGLLRGQPHAGEWTASSTVTSLVRAGLAFDTRVSRLVSALGLELPGLSWWALCRRRP